MLAGIFTVAAMAAFLAGVVWAMSGKRKRDFDAAAQLPLDEDDSPAANSDGKDK